MSPHPARPQLVRKRRVDAGTTTASSEGSSPLHPFDARFGTDTGGLLPGAQIATGEPADRYITAYYAVAPSIFRSLLDLWQQRCAPPFALDRYTFVDIGAGKGRAMLLAAENPFAAVWAVERNQTLAQIAAQNLDRATNPDPSRKAAEPALDALAPIRILNTDALTLQLPTTPSVLFLFHPFEAPAMLRLLRSIAAQFAGRSRELDLLYVNAEHSAVLDRAPHFTRLWQGRLPMSTEDHLADLREIENQQEYGSTGDELCAIYRFMGAPARPKESAGATTPTKKRSRKSS